MRQCQGRERERLNGEIPQRSLVCSFADSLWIAVSSRLFFFRFPLEEWWCRLSSLLNIRSLNHRLNDALMQGKGFLLDDWGSDCNNFRERVWSEYPGERGKGRRKRNRLTAPRNKTSRPAGLSFGCNSSRYFPSLYCPIYLLPLPVDAMDLHLLSPHSSHTLDLRSFFLNSVWLFPFS